MSLDDHTPFFMHHVLKLDRSTRKKTIKKHNRLLRSVARQKIHLYFYPLGIFAISFGMLAYIGMDNLSSLLIGYGFTYALYRLSGIESRLQLDNTALIQQARAVFPYFNHYFSSVPEALQTHIYQIHLATRFENHLQHLTQRYIALVYPNRFKRFLFKSFVEKKAEKYRDMGLSGYLLAHSPYSFSERVIYSVIDFNFSHIFKLSNGAVSSIHKIKAFKEVKKMNDIQRIEGEKKINKAKKAKEAKKAKK